MINGITNRAYALEYNKIKKMSNIQKDRQHQDSLIIDVEFEDIPSKEMSNRHHCDDICENDLTFLTYDRTGKLKTMGRRSKLIRTI